MPIFKWFLKKDRSQFTLKAPLAENSLPIPISFFLSHPSPLVTPLASKMGEEGGEIGMGREVFMAGVFRESVAWRKGKGKKENIFKRKTFTHLQADKNIANSTYSYVPYFFKIYK